MTPRALIVYGTSYGQTAKIAEHIAAKLETHGMLVTIFRGDRLPPSFDITEYDGTIVGASLVRGGYQAYIRRFVKVFAGQLNRHPSAFFAVSGSAGSANADERKEAERIATHFTVTAAWRPTMLVSLAGAIAYTKYNVVLRWFMKRISRKEGASTDTSRDHEYTDWAQVDAFADGFADCLLAHARVPAHTAV